MSKVALLYTTIDSMEKAKKIAEQSVTEKHATCVNIIPNAISIYLFEGKIEKSAECLLLFKTDQTRIQALQKWIKLHHPYTLPALLKGSVDSSDEFSDYIKTNLI